MISSNNINVEYMIEKLSDYEYFIISLGSSLTINLDSYNDRTYYFNTDIEYFNINFNIEVNSINKQLLSIDNVVEGRIYIFLHVYALVFYDINHNIINEIIIDSAYRLNLPPANLYSFIPSSWNTIYNSFPNTGYWGLKVKQNNIIDTGPYYSTVIKYTK